MKTTTKNQPTHRAYAVTKRGDKSYWREIGAAWALRGRAPAFQDVAEAERTSWKATPDGRRA